MKERPILFSAPMVRAILDGRKTQTRRIVKPQPELNEDYQPSQIDRYTTHPEFWWPSNAARSMVSIADMAGLGPYGSRGDRLWVRETWSLMNRERTEAWTRKLSDRPDDAEVVYRVEEDHGHKAWRPSIFMPRWASRITLEVVSVRVERVQAISKDDAIAEGAQRFDDIPPSKMFPDSPHQNRWSMESPEDCGQCLGSPQSAFGNLWIKINGQESWTANPFVWVVSFKRIEAQELPDDVERRVREQL